MRFYEEDITKETLWRSIILFGRNVASYKFALGSALLMLAEKGQNYISLQDLAPIFTSTICKHIKDVPKQGTFGSSKFLNTCRAFNAGEISQDELVKETVKRGFKNVIDAFHVVNKGEVPVRFFIDERNSKKGLVLTDELLSLVESNQFGNFPYEVEARWHLVETAWSLGIAPALMQVSYAEEEELLVFKDRLRRIDISSCRDSLNGYQKGFCFYSNDPISLKQSSKYFCDIDHFFPHTLKQFPEFDFINLDGVWNLVLSCKQCNRGKGGKFERVPSLKLLERLHCRNEYYIWSHHPLRETIINQTGKNEIQRRNFLQKVFSLAIQRLIHTWEPQEGVISEKI